MPLRVGSSDLNTPDRLVTRWQKVMLARFAAYAKAVDGGPLRVDGYYGYDDADVCREYQRRTGQTPTGVVSDADLTSLGLVRPKPTLITVCGTGVPWWVGPDADLARAVESKFYWQPVGYPAAPFPMWPSILAGCRELITQINLHPGMVCGCGYSQGAIVWSLVWKYHILPVWGQLHHRLPDIARVVTFGNPMREQGRVAADGVSVARPGSAGIMEDRLVDTPAWWHDYGHSGDIYTDCELDDEGEDKRAICKIVMGHDVFTGPDSIIAQVFELTARPLREGLAMVKAVADAGLFFARRTGPHVNYRVDAARDYLLG